MPEKGTKEDKLGVHRKEINSIRSEGNFEWRKFEIMISKELNIILSKTDLGTYRDTSRNILFQKWGAEIEN